MSNDYFDDDDWAELQRLNLVRSAELNAIVQAVVAGFDKIPAELRLKLGRSTYLGTATGTANAHVVSFVYAPVPLALVDGQEIVYKAPDTNTGPATVNPGGIGATQIRTYSGSALVGGEMPAGTFVALRYDSTGYFRIVNPVTAIASVVVNNLMKVTTNDSTPGTLDGKVSPVGAIVRRILAAAGDERYQLKLRETQAVPITANTTLGVGTINSIDTSAGAITTLNAPAIGTGDTLLQDGDFFVVKDVGGALETNNCTINYNGKTCRFMDQSADTTLVMNDNFVEVTSVWDSSADLWIATAIWKA